MTWAASALLCVPIALISYRYLAGTTEVPDGISANAFRDPWLMLHAGAAATALLLSPLQFLGGVRARAPGVHRWLGRVYVFSCLSGGVTGLVLAAGASTGWISTAGFGMLGILWIVTTAQGWRMALQRRFPAHRAWMIRSFGLTFAAVTLRLYLFGLEALPLDQEAGYRAIAWLCWVPNLLLAEVILRRAKRS